MADPAPPPRPAAAPEGLEAIARQLADAIRAAERAPPETRPRLVLFRVGAARYALPLAAIREVVLPAPLSRVPRAPAALLGIMNLRGRVVAVVDLARVLPAAPAPAAASPDPAEARVLLLERGRREVGLLVGAVEGIVAALDAAAPGAEGAPQPLDPDDLAAAIEALVG